MLPKCGQALKICGKNSFFCVNQRGNFILFYTFVRVSLDYLRYVINRLLI